MAETRKWPTFVKDDPIVLKQLSYIYNDSIEINGNMYVPGIDRKGKYHPERNPYLYFIRKELGFENVKKIRHGFDDPEGRKMIYAYLYANENNNSKYYELRKILEKPNPREDPAFQNALVSYDKKIMNDIPTMSVNALKRDTSLSFSYESNFTDNWDISLRVPGKLQNSMVINNTNVRILRLINKKTNDVSYEPVTDLGNINDSAMKERIRKREKEGNKVDLFSGISVLNKGKGITFSIVGNEKEGTVRIIDPKGNGIATLLIDGKQLTGDLGKNPIFKEIRITEKNTDNLVAGFSLEQQQKVAMSQKQRRNIN
ncbi:MAG: hypothetical protein NTY68_01565 [Candidatus Micrarchaeota archaeon]|nr:hypothetical protein [Candidatus Micrarchaeota archaeon]